MRYRKTFFLIFLTLCLLTFGSVSYAEEEVKVEIIGTDPVELTQAGNVTVTFEISNHSDYEVSNLSIVHGESLYQVPEDTIIPVAGSAKIPVAVTVSDAQIGMPLLFKVNWHCGGEPYFLNKEVTIDRAVEPTITMTREVSDSHARSGEKLTLTYTLKNDTKFDMTDIMLIDESVSDNPIRRNDTLRANDSFRIEYTYTMGSSDVISAPVVTYVVNGKTKSFSSIEPITLSMVSIDIRLHAEQGTPSATGVPFTLYAENRGNQKVTDLVIKDEQGNLINQSPFSLDPGESQTFSHTIAPVMGESIRNAVFSMSGTDDFGDPCNSDPTEIFQIFPFVDDTQIQVSIQGQITEEWTAQTGTVAVRLLIQNNSSVTLSNAVLSETSLGVLQNYATLSNGQTIYEGELTIGSPRNLNFALLATDPAGTERMAAQSMLTVAYPDATEVPSEPTAVPQEVTPSSGIWSNVITRALIILGAIMVIAFAILLILTILERSHHMDDFSLFDEDDAEDDDDFDEMFDEVETVYSDDTIEYDEQGTPLTPDYLERAHLRIASSTYGNTYASDDSYVPSYDDVMQSTTPIRRQNYNTQSIPVKQTTGVFRKPGYMSVQQTGNINRQTDIIFEDIPSSTTDRRYDHEYYDGYSHNRAAADFSTESDYTADYDDGYSYNRTAEKEPAYFDRNVPKNIPVHRAPRTQTQRRNTIKRVTTTHEHQKD